jgi:hypothetical protein
MCVQYNIEARSRNHCCGGKVISVIYLECLFLAFVIQHAKRISIEHKMYFDILYNFL